MAWRNTWGVVAQAWPWAQRVVIYVVALALVAIPFATLLEWRYAEFFRSRDVAMALVGAVIACGFSMFSRLYSFVERISSADRCHIIEGGVDNVYDSLMHVFNDRAVRGRGRRFRSLEVLGLTLFTAWPKILGFLKREDSKNCQVTLYCLAPDFIEANADLFPETWAQQARTQIDDINVFVGKHGESLRKRDLLVTLITYEMFPAIHGFRVNGNDVFCAFAHWESDRVNQPYDFYEYFAAEDSGVRANSYRGLFASWIDRARRAGRLNVASEDGGDEQGGS